MPAEDQYIRQLAEKMLGHPVSAEMDDAAVKQHVVSELLNDRAV